jgi:23S rRNA (adenine2030-N6)-methyltransferase
MNYRHGFHAGNFADVVKHLALVAVVQYLCRKPTPFAVIDTHAGRGLYDLEGPEARRTGESANGIGRLRGISDVPPLLAAYLGLAGTGSSYPGSPLFAARLLRPQDRLVAIERQPEEAALLEQALQPFRRARVEQGDGYLRLAALLPPPERRGLVLIDPPYEAADEFEAAARAFHAAYRRFATGTYLIWFPVKSPADADLFCGEILSAGPAKALRLEVARRGAEEGRLAAAGLLVVNPPWPFEDEMRTALARVLPLINADLRLDRLAG